MKRLTFKSVLFGVLFAAIFALMSTTILSDPIKPVERITWLAFDSGDGNPGDTSGDGGIRNPGPGH
jgi:hypothetical protein